MILHFFGIIFLLPIVHFWFFLDINLIEPIDTYFVISRLIFSGPVVVIIGLIITRTHSRWHKVFGIAFIAVAIVWIGDLYLTFKDY